MYEELKDKGMGLVAVNGFDSDAVINKYIEEKKFTFQVGMADKKEGGATYDVALKYGVSAYPTNYLVDSSGKVIWRGIGFNEEAIRKALTEAGVK
jgi:thioredoxin-related protein